MASWNVRTLLDLNPTRPERRTALVSQELLRLDIDIAALSETRLSGEGHLREEGGGYTIFWKGYDPPNPRQHGVGFAIKNGLMSKLTELPVGINERLMTLRLQIGEDSHATLISAYAPTLDSDDQTKESFYSNLDALLSSIPNGDKIVLLGDFNARIGVDSQVWRGTIGKDGVGKINSNGTLLLSKCAEFNLFVTNTMFRQKNKYKTTWQHPRSKHWHLIDYIIVRARDRKDVLITKVAPLTEDCWTDHRLVFSIMRIKIKNKKRNPNATKRFKFNTDLLQLPNKRLQLQQAFIKTSPSQHPIATEDHWQNLKAAIHDACSESIGFKKHVNKDWFDENDHEIVNLIEQTRKALACHLNNLNSESKRKKHRDLKAKVQSATRTIKNNWWTNKAKELQTYIDKNDMKNFFSATRVLYGPSTQGLAPLRSKDGARILKSNKDILARWKEHFEDLLNRNPVIDDNAIHQIPQQPIDDSLSRIPSLEEVKTAIFAMKNNKAAGIDNIPAEIYKHGGPLLHSQLHQLIVKIWVKEEIPTDLRDGLITTIFKKKGERTDCGNHRGITLLSIAGKILARILTKRLTPLAEAILPESQCGFRPSRGTTDMIFSLRQLQEKCQEQNQPLYMAFIDLTKAFDSVSRDLLWKILSKAGCPEKFINIMRLLHDDMTATVIANGESTDPFKVKSGVKQGCIAAPTLFSIFIASILHLMDNQLPPGISITYRTDGGIYNLRRLKARTKTTIDSLIEFQYADDNAVCALNEADLQVIINSFADAYSKIGLSINVQKTQVLFQPSPGDNNRIPPNIQLGGDNLENVDRFAYLGSHLSSNATIDDEIQYRIRCASTSFGKLRSRVFEDRDLRLDTKILVYKAIVLPTLLYASETWTTYRRHIKALEKLNQRFLRKILRINWQDRRTNISVLEESGCTSVEAIIVKNRLRWAGHVVRMNDQAYPKKIFYSELTEGNRAVGGQKKRYKDCLKESMKNCELDWKTWETGALERTSWRGEIRDGVERFETRRRQHVQELREGRAARRENPPQLPNDNICPNCGRVCGSRIGLISHMRTH